MTTVEQVRADMISLIHLWGQGRGGDLPTSLLKFSISPLLKPKYVPSFKLLRSDNHRNIIRIFGIKKARGVVVRHKAPMAHTK